MPDIAGTTKNNERLATQAARRREEKKVDTAAITRESPIALLILKLEGWMVQQPEWLLIVALPRQQRRAAMKELANRLYTIPMMDGVNTVPRQLRRKVKKQVSTEAVSLLREGQQSASDVLGAVLRESMLREAEASVALDGQTVSAQAEDPGPVGPVTPAGEPFSVSDPAPGDARFNPDPEGDIKADIEKALEAELKKGEKS